MVSGYVFRWAGQPGVAADALFHRMRAGNYARACVAMRKYVLVSGIQIET
jgi:hypothetical protein